MGNPDLVIIINEKAYLILGKDYTKEADAIKLAVERHNIAMQGTIMSYQEAPDGELLKDRQLLIREVELDFEVKNNTGKTVYACCFSYVKERSFDLWHWDKSPVYKLEATTSAFMNIDTIPDEEYREHTFGYLALFDDEK